jgi:hypothetical protein
MLPCTKHPLIRAMQRRSETGVADDIVNIAKMALQVANECRNTSIDYRFVGGRKDVTWNALPLSQEQNRDRSWPGCLNRAFWTFKLQPQRAIQTTTLSGSPFEKPLPIARRSRSAPSVALSTQSRLEQGKEIGVCSRSLGGFCKVLGLHFVSGVWNGVCNNPLLAFLGNIGLCLRKLSARATNTCGWN